MHRPKSLQFLLPLPFREREITAPAQAWIDGALLRYTVKRSRRRRAISLTIDEAGLRVSAPWSAGDGAIERVLHGHAAWIIAKLREWERRKAPPVAWTEGAAFMLQGRTVTLRCGAGVSGARISGDCIEVGAADVETAVVAALRETALAFFTGRVAHFCDALALAHPQVRLSNARTRWGSCHAGGRIRLNWRMIQMPVRLIDYVVAHEVAHLREMNHSARFWRVVEQLVPDYALRRREIRQEGQRYLVV